MSNDSDKNGPRRLHQSSREFPFKQNIWHFVVISLHARRFYPHGKSSSPCRAHDSLLLQKQARLLSLTVTFRLSERHAVLVCELWRLSFTLSLQIWDWCWLSHQCLWMCQFGLKNRKSLKSITVILCNMMHWINGCWRTGWKIVHTAQGRNFIFWEMGTSTDLCCWMASVYSPYLLFLKRWIILLHNKQILGFVKWGTLHTYKC